MMKELDRLNQTTKSRGIFFVSVFVLFDCIVTAIFRSGGLPLNCLLLLQHKKRGGGVEWGRNFHLALG